MSPIATASERNERLCLQHLSLEIASGLRTDARNTQNEAKASRERTWGGVDVGGEGAAGGTSHPPGRPPQARTRLRLSAFELERAR